MRLHLILGVLVLAACGGAEDPGAPTEIAPGDAGIRMRGAIDLDDLAGPLADLAKSRDPSHGVPPDSESSLGKVVALLAAGKDRDAMVRWASVVEELVGEDDSIDVDGLVAWLLDRTYVMVDPEMLQAVEKLRFCEKIQASVEIAQGTRRDLQALRAGLAAGQRARVSSFTIQLGEPTSIPPEDCLCTAEEMDAILEQWDETLQTLGEDAQLANIDMQNMLQKQQQTMQMMSQISKMLHDTATDVIRKMGG